MNKTLDIAIPLYRSRTMHDVIVRNCVVIHTTEKTRLLRGYKKKKLVEFWLPNFWIRRTIEYGESSTVVIDREREGELKFTQ